MTRIFSEEHKRKLSLARIGKKRSASARENISKGKKGKAVRKPGFKHSAETRLKMSEAQKGEKGSNWQGGKTKASTGIRTSARYKEWRKSVFERDNYTCQICGARNGNGKTIKLNADHIKPLSKFPNLIFELSNGRTLCVPCHKETPTFGGNIHKLKKQANEANN